MNAESTANENQPPHNAANDPGSRPGRMNTTRISIASTAPVAALEKMIFFQFTNSPNLRFLIISKVKFEHKLRLLMKFRNSAACIIACMKLLKPNK
jgi:hypothetical protein